MVRSEGYVRGLGVRWEGVFLVKRVESVSRGNQPSL